MIFGQVLIYLDGTIIAPDVLSIEPVFRGGLAKGLLVFMPEGADVFEAVAGGEAFANLFGAGGDVEVADLAGRVGEGGVGGIHFSGHLQGVEARF